MLERQRFVIAQRPSTRRAPEAYDILDPDTHEPVGVAREVLGPLLAFLGLRLRKGLLPGRLEVRELPDESLVFTVRKPMQLVRTQVEVKDADDHRVGTCRNPCFTPEGAFWIYDADDQRFAEIRGDWGSGRFRFVAPDGQELGTVTRRWEGPAKELDKTPDNYIVAIDDELRERPFAKMLLLAAALAIDIVYTERA